mmetsp:Transcript_6211/g.15451  ORF Transcript_6211/g.15451 Transcript_6211/m.15451 type:complete len:392 (+) Transcript_6211:167-1342(+)
MHSSTRIDSAILIRMVQGKSAAFLPTNRPTLLNMDQRVTPTSPKRQKSCAAIAAATTTTVTSNHPPLAPQEHQLENGESSTKLSHLICEACHQTLPSHLFPKEKFAKKAKKNQHNNKIVCRQCRKNQTAERCKQPTKSQIKLGRKGDSGVARRPNNFGYCDYVDRLFSMDCFPDIVSLRAFASAKDVSESMAAIQAACQHGRLSKRNNNKRRPQKVMCLCIGDGSTPRTAVLACFLQKWTHVVSIDPALHEEWRGAEPKGVRGLTGFGGTLEEFLAQYGQKHRNGDIVDGSFGGSATTFDHLLLLCVHSHARLTGSASVPNIMAKYGNVSTCTLVSLPCCPKFRSQKDVGRVPDVRYEDDCVFSACRRVEVWNFEHTVQYCMEVAKDNSNS